MFALNSLIAICFDTFFLSRIIPPDIKVIVGGNLLRFNRFDRRNRTGGQSSCWGEKVFSRIPHFPGLARPKIKSDMMRPQAILAAVVVVFNVR